MAKAVITTSIDVSSMQQLEDEAKRRKMKNATLAREVLQERFPPTEPATEGDDADDALFDDLGEVKR